MPLGDGIRRNIAAVEPAERSLLRDAMLELNRRFFPGSSRDRIPGGGVSWWFKQDELHQATHVHEGPEFLPWHREIVNRLEEMIRRINPQLSLHYWDWTENPRWIPNANLGGGRTGNLNLFTPDFMGYGGFRDLSIGPPWQNAAGPPWQSDGFYVPGASPNRDDSHNPADPPRDVTRFIAPFLPWISVDRDRDILSSADYAAMRRLMESAHDDMHAFVNMGRQHFSFRDPFVFLLHSNVDRLFARWQTDPAYPERLHPHAVYGADSNRDVMAPAGIQNVNHNIEPWSTGRSALPVRPWSAPENLGEPKNYKHPSIVLPPAYDALMGHAGRWQHADLTETAQAPIAAAGALIGHGWQSGASKQVAYLTGGDGHLHELYASFVWDHVDLMTLPTLRDVRIAPGLPIAAYSWEIDHSKLVVYVTTDGHIHELSVRIGGAWQHTDLMTMATLRNAPPATGSIAAYAWEMGESKQVVYVAASGHIHELYFTVDGGWQHVDLTQRTGAPNAGDSPIAAYSWKAGASKQVVYATDDGDVHELSVRVGGRWQHTALMSLERLRDAPSAAGSPIAAYSWETGQSKQLVYLTPSSHIHELYFTAEGGWNHMDLTTATGAPSAADSEIAAYSWEAGASKQVVYVGNDRHVHELYVRVGGRWNHLDLTAHIPDAPDAARHRPILGYSWEKRWSKQVVFLTDDGHVHELYVQA